MVITRNETKFSSLVQQSNIGVIPLTGKAQTPYRHRSKASTITGRNSIGSLKICCPSAVSIILCLCLLLQVIDKVIQNRAVATIVAPELPGQP